MKPTRPVRLRFSYHDGGYEAHIARNGRFYGFCSIKRCTTKEVAYYIEMLIPGGFDWVHLCNPVSTLKEAKANARAIVEGVLADLQGVTLLPDAPAKKG